MSIEPLDVELEYQARLRYKEIAPVSLRIRNSGAGPIDTVTVVFDTAYVAAFSNVRFLPQPKRPYVIELTDVMAGETALVTAELQAERYGAHPGTITVAGAGEAVELAVRTTTLP